MLLDGMAFWKLKMKRSRSRICHFRNVLDQSWRACFMLTSNSKYLLIATSLSQCLWFQFLSLCHGASKVLVHFTCKTYLCHLLTQSANSFRINYNIHNLMQLSKIEIIDKTSIMTHLKLHFRGEFVKPHKLYIFKIFGKLGLG